MRAGKVLIGLIATVVAVVALSAFLSAMVMVIWPGSFEFTAPVLCPDDLRDAVVVEYSVQTSDGTGTNFTLFCVGELGEFEEIGTWLPYLVLIVFVAAVLLAIIVAVVVGLTIRAVTGTRARRRRSGVGGVPDRPAPLTSSPAPEDSGGPLIS